MNSHNNPLQDVNLDNYYRAIQFFVVEDERERVWERRVQKCGSANTETMFFSLIFFKHVQLNASALVKGLSSPQFRSSCLLFRSSYLNHSIKVAAHFEALA